MANISKINVNNNEYNIKDAVARGALGTLTGSSAVPTALNNKVGYADYRTVTESGATKHYIYFYKNDSDAPTNASTIPSTYLCKIDAAPFIKDGMVSSVAISNGNLVITWNSDSTGVTSPTTIPLTDIFNPDNYYQKPDVVTSVNWDDTGTNGKITYTKNNAPNDVVDVENTPTSGSKKPISSGKMYSVLNEMIITPGTGANADKTTIQLKDGTSATVLIEHQDISGKQDKPRGLIGFLSDNFGIDALFEEDSSFPKTEETARQLTAAEEAAMHTIHNELGNNTETWENEIFGFPLLINGADPYSWQGILYSQGGIIVLSYEFHRTGDLEYWFTVSTSTIATSESLATVATSGSYNDLTDTPTIPDELADLSDDSTHRVVTDTEKTTWNTKVIYGKLTSGSFYKGTRGSGGTWNYASTATAGAVDKVYVDVNVNPPKIYVWDGTFKELSITVDSDWITNSTNPVQSKVVKAAIDAKYTLPNGGITTSDLSDGVVTSLGKADTAYQKPNDGIPASDLAGSIPTSKITGLATVATSGSYSDLSSKPKLDTTATTAQTTSATEEITGTIKLHKVAKTGTYSDLVGKPTNVSAFTNDAGYQTSSQVTSAISSAVSGSYTASTETLSLTLPTFTTA